jgi:hypothetical protein
VTLLCILNVWCSAAKCGAIGGDCSDSKDGRVEIDRQQQSHPVIKVHLFDGKTKGIGLGRLTKLPEIEWIGLHESDITTLT